jgi:hypothetical protein
MTEGVKMTRNDVPTVVVFTLLLTLAVAPAFGQTNSGLQFTGTHPDATVSGSALGDLTAPLFRRSALPAAAKFTLIVLPDVQYYTTNLNGGTPGMFTAQTQWCLDNKTLRNIKYVNQLGDMTDDNKPASWNNANTSLSLLDAVPPGLPYGFVLGNHDTAGTRINNNYFPVSRFAGRPYYGGHYGSNNDHHFDFFDSEGLEFIVVNLSFRDKPPSTAVLDWADSILKAYSTKRAIVVNHYIINDGNPASFSPVGKALYDGLKNNPNLFLMLCGHWSTTGIRHDTFNGNTIYSVLSDYQGEPNGGNGWLRIMEFDPPNNQIHVSTYSPTLDQWWTDADNQFDIPYMMTSLPLPIQLATFTVAAAPGGAVILHWATLSETQNYGFEVQRSQDRESGFATIPGSFVPGHGTTVEPHDYSYTDSTAGTANHYYRLMQIDMDATVHYTEAIESSGTSDVKQDVPVVSVLEQNYPNPFNPTTKIRLTIHNRQSTILKVYDLLGREVATLMNEVKEPGTYTVEFDASGISGGVYFYRMQAGDIIQARKLVVLK